MEFVFCRSKFGATVYCRFDSITSEYVLSDNQGVEILRTRDNCRNDVTGESYFFAAWQAITGNTPFSVIRNYRGKFKRIGQGFALSGKIVNHNGIKFGARGKITCKQETA